jgi:methenyltetrahydrofolate cyclohydrolase
MEEGNDMDRSIEEFIRRLSSKEPTPGGGGASALIGAIGAALCAMVANLTSGKKKYAEFQVNIDATLRRLEGCIPRLLSLIEKDAKVFIPLSVAYGMPKEDPARETVLENALVDASSVPAEILDEVFDIVEIIEELSEQGSRLAISDVAVAASACRSAMEGAAMNVYINTKLMSNREYAEYLNTRPVSILTEGIARCDKVYAEISQDLRGTN